MNSAAVMLALLAWSGLSVPLPARAANAGDNPPVPELPAPASDVFRLPTFVPWPAGAVPAAPAGFRIERYVDGLDAPRNLYVLPNGDLLVAEGRTERMGEMPDAVIKLLTDKGIFGESPDRIMLVRTSGGRATAEVFLEGLNQPFGLLLRDGWLYVANTDGLVRFPYRDGQRRITAPPETVLPLPAEEPNNHWTRNVVATPDGRHLLVTVGAATNVNESGNDNPERAAIWQIRPDGSGKRLLATGLRNPVGLDFDPRTGELWTTVNERDGLGPDVPPDYLTRVVDGAFYGWPYVYYGTYPDPTHRKKNPDQVLAAKARARVPDLALGGHSVPLGLTFLRGKVFPARYRSGAFIARRGGASRVQYLGYDVVFVPFVNGRPDGRIEEFLGGFVEDYAEATVRGRPVGIAELKDGSLVVSDDRAGILWRVSAEPVTR